MKWENPKIELTVFDTEEILTASSMTVEEAHYYVDIDGAKGNFKENWLFQ